MIPVDKQINYDCVHHHFCTAHLLLLFLNQSLTFWISRFNCLARLPRVALLGFDSLEYTAIMEASCSSENLVLVRVSVKIIKCQFRST